MVLITGCRSDAISGVVEHRVEHSKPVSLGSSGARLEPVTCWLPTPDVAPKTLCFRMYVPENYDNPDKLINFPVVRLSNKFAEGKSLLTPVLHLGGGGPGNPMGFNPDRVGWWIWYLYQHMSLDSNRDLYLIDPRGVGYAEPSLSCEEYIPAFLDVIDQNLSLEEDIAWSDEADRECVERFREQNIDLSGYNSLAVARDIELVRQAFELEKWNLYGISYGSRYALTIAREYPQTVESMVLDGAVFPNITYMQNYARDFSSAFENLFSECEENQRCDALHPDVREEFCI